MQNACDLCKRGEGCKYCWFNYQLPPSDPNHTPDPSKAKPAK